MTAKKIGSLIVVIVQALFLQGAIGLMGYGSSTIGIAKNLGIFVCFLAVLTLNRILTDIDHDKI